MYLAHIAIFLVHVFAIRADECDDQTLVAIVKGYLVKKDPSKDYNGRFSNVWVKEEYVDFSTASGSIYEVQGDGSIKETAKILDLQGNDKTAATELLKKTDTIGVFDMSSLVTTGQPYTGKTYVFHCDGNIIGFFGCMTRGDGWNLAIQVRSDKKDLIADTAEDNEVKKSLKAAVRTVGLIIKASPTLTNDQFIQMTTLY